MYGKQAHKQYTSVQISTIDRGRLLVMLYDGAIKFLKLSKEGLENNDLAKFARFLSKAQAIIAELMNTLDFEAGGQIAKDLDRLYDFMLFYLTEANLQKDSKKVARVITLVETIADAYRAIIDDGTYKLDEAVLRAEEVRRQAEQESVPGAGGLLPEPETKQKSSSPAETPRLRVSL